MGTLPRRRKWVRWLILLAAVGVGLWLGGSLLVVDALTGRPRRPYPEPPPALTWGTIQPLRLSTSDGQELGAWFIPGRSDRPVVLLLHGNGGSRSGCLAEAELAASAGHPVLLVTLRAHGDSTGDRNDFGYSARHDVLAAVAWLEAEHSGQPVVIWGQSLGAAAALFASAELGNRVRGYILECPYRDLRTAVRNRTRLRFPVILDRVAYAGLSLTAPLILGDVNRLSPLDAAAGISPGTSVLVLAGGADRHATPEEARALAERIGPAAELVVFDGAGHLGLRSSDPDRYRATVLGFLDRITTAR